LIITMSHLSRDTTCRWRSQTPQDAMLHHALKILVQTVLPDSRVRSTLVGSLWDARVTVWSIPTRLTHQAAVRALTTPLKLARVLESLITPTSSRIAQMHMRIRLMNRVGLHFGLVRRRPMRITRLPSALKVSHARLSSSAEIAAFCFLISPFYVCSGDSTSTDEGCIK